MKSRTISILVASLFVILPVAAANGATYQIDGFDVFTKTFPDGNTATLFQFTVRDADDFNSLAIEKIVDSVTVTGPNGFSQTVTDPVMVRWAFVEFLGTDSNLRDGIIDPSQGEFEKRANGGIKYSILSTISPHDTGDYTLTVTCSDGQTPSATASAVPVGLDAAAFPPLMSVVAAFNAQNLLEVSWDAPVDPYPTEYGIEIRVDRFNPDGSKRHIRHRVTNLPSAATSYVFKKFESDAIRLLAAFIDVKVRVNADDGVNIAHSLPQSYVSDGATLTPAMIPPPVPGDINRDGLVGLPEAVHALRVVAGVTPPTGEAAVIADTIAAAEDAFNNKDISALMAFFSEDYLDGGETKADMQAEIQSDFNEDPFEPISFTILSIHVDGDTATAGIQEEDGWIDKWHFRKEGDIWKLYGDQEWYWIDVYSAHHTDGHYTANIIIEDEKQQITSASADGPGLQTGGVALGQSQDGMWWALPGDQPHPDLGTEPPATPPTYTITITDNAGTHTYERSITGYVVEFASNLAPTGSINDPPTFSWTGISNAHGYSFSMHDSNHNHVWSDYEIHPVPSNTYSLTYSGPALVPGETYTYYVGSHIETDGNWNGSFISAAFTYTGTAPSAVTINFDDLDTSGGPVSGQVLDTYLSGYGVTITESVGDGSPSPLSVVADALNAGEINVVASSAPNVLNPPYGATVSYTLTFNAPVSSVGFTRAGYCTSLAYPGWTATARDATGVEIDTVSEPSGSTGAACTSPDPVSATYTLTGTGITSVTFISGHDDFYGRTGPAIDDLVLE